MMPKRVFIIHGWDGYPEEGWFPWLKRELELHGFEVHIPPMPNPNEPRIDTWVSHLAQVVIEPDERTFLVGHSVGCQTIMRYLEGVPVGKRVGGAVFVAGWFVLSDLETEKEKIIGKPWIETPIDLGKVRAVAGNLVAILSEDDPTVPFQENKKRFEENLGAKIVVENGKGHFSGSDGITDLPSALEAILEIAK